MLEGQDPVSETTPQGPIDARRIDPVDNRDRNYPFYAIGIVIALVVVIGVALALANRPAEPETVDMEDTSAAAQAANVDLLGIEEVISADDATAFVGDSILLTNAEVQSVTTDFGTFWVGPDADTQIFVILSEPLSDRLDSDVLSALQAGELVTLRGSIETMPQGEEAAESRHDEDNNRNPQLDELPVYVLADELTLETELESSVIGTD